jgi:8-oxo-dGTP pyrophosphatase MutT (NUDIX family)
VTTECMHEWSEWGKMLWYTPQGRLVGEARKCGKCPAVETRNVEIDPRPAVVQPTIGVFAGIFDEEGKLLLKKITSGKFAGEWDLPGGGVDGKRSSQAPDERIFWEELVRHVEEEAGISISVTSRSRILAPAVLKGGGDWAFPIVVGICKEKPTKGETGYYSPREIRELARGSEGNRLLSGEDKRMYRLAMRLACHSPNPEYAREAEEIISETQDKLGME